MIFADDLSVSWPTVVVTSLVTLVPVVFGAIVLFMKQRSANNTTDTDARIAEMRAKNDGDIARAAAALLGYEALSKLQTARIENDNKVITALQDASAIQQKELIDCTEDRAEGRIAIGVLCNFSKWAHECLVALGQNPGPIEDVERLSKLADKKEQPSGAEFLANQAKHTIMATKQVDKEIAEVKAAIPEVKLEVSAKLGEGNASPPG